MKKLLTLIITILIMLFTVACNENNDNNIYSYVLLEFHEGINDIKVEFILDNNNKVVTYNGINNESKIVLYNSEFKNSEFKNSELNLFLKSLIKKCNECKILKDKNDKTNISISVGGNDTQENLHILEMKVLDTLDTYFKILSLNYITRVNNILSDSDLLNNVLNIKPYAKYTYDKNKLFSELISGIEFKNSLINEQLQTTFSKISNYIYLLNYYNEVNKLMNNDLDDLLIDLKEAIKKFNNVNYEYLSNQKYQELFNELYIKEYEYLKYKLTLSSSSYDSHLQDSSLEYYNCLNSLENLDKDYNDKIRPIQDLIDSIIYSIDMIKKNSNVNTESVKTNVYNYINDYNYLYSEYEKIISKDVIGKINNLVIEANKRLLTK